MSFCSTPRWTTSLRVPAKAIRPSTKRFSSPDLRSWKTRPSQWSLASAENQATSVLQFNPLVPNLFHVAEHCWPLKLWGNTSDIQTLLRNTYGKKAQRKTLKFVYLSFSAKHLGLACGTLVFRWTVVGNYWSNLRLASSPALSVGMILDYYIGKPLLTATSE